MQDYLKLHLSKFNNTHKEIDKFKVNTNKYYMMSGSYITPFASSKIKTNSEWNYVRHNMETTSKIRCVDSNINYWQHRFSDRFYIQYY